MKTQEFETEPNLDAEFIVGPIKTEAEHIRALQRAYDLMQMDHVEGSPLLDELGVLVLLIEAYEAIHHPIGPPDPVAVIKMEMEQRGLKQAQMVPYFGSRSRVSEVLSGKRQLTLDMIRKLHRGLGIPLASLVGV